MTEPDPALLIADDDERGEAEPSTALDHLGHAVDVNELVDELAFAIFAIVPIVLSCHRILPSFLVRVPGR